MLIRLAVLGCLVGAALPASAAKLRRPASETFFVEPFLVIVIPLSAHDDALARAGFGETTWNNRFGFGASFGGRVWDPLLLDVGLRTSLTFQGSYTANESRQSYSSSITLFEIVPFARGSVFPFGTDAWGVSAELGLGLLVAGGGKAGSMEVPKEAQMALRLRVALGATWRISASQAATFDVLSMVTDFPVTTEWKDDLGTVFSVEPRVGYQFRF